jgi:hypothetical protein
MLLVWQDTDGSHTQELVNVNGMKTWRMSQKKNKKEVIDVILERLDNIDRKIVEIEQMISDILRDKRIRYRTDD